MRTIWRLFFLLCIGFVSNAIYAGDTAFYQPQISATVLTCSPGPDLYSLFGHTAIRLRFEQKGHMRDLVYNYGTFEFGDDFYMKFTKGKLDYMLSRSDFQDFMQEYQLTGRGVVEQVLNLTPEEAAQLLQLLETNLLPENRYYRYDFFYDNCATRVRDMIAQVCAQSGDSINFTHVPAEHYSFRRGIQNYLDYMPWSDLGIDIALGKPCDRLMGKGQDMFLPDSLYNEFRFALRGNDELVSTETTLLPKLFSPEPAGFWKPVNLFFLFLILQVIWGLWRLGARLAASKSPLILPDRLLFFISGLVGVLVIFLWFFTDHLATRPNLNVLWAHPLHVVFAFAGRIRSWHRWYATVHIVILFVLFLGFFLFTQRLHWAVIPLALGQLFVCMKLLKPNWLMGEKTNQIVFG
ncbi:MAG: DUF4105 domain-containing protein [Flavobacteriales bacterium]|nr:DUF4105 domain-containing protein [Flavobacteriales bacterium]